MGGSFIRHWLCLYPSKVAIRRPGQSHRVLREVTGTYSKDQGGISTNACRLYLRTRGLTPGCSVAGGAQAFLYVLSVNPSDTSN